MIVIERITRKRLMRGRITTEGVFHSLKILFRCWTNFISGINFSFSLLLHQGALSLTRYFYVLVNKAWWFSFQVSLGASPSHSHQSSPTLSPLLFTLAGTLVLWFCSVTLNVALWLERSKQEQNLQLLQFLQIPIKNLHFFLGSPMLVS